MKTASSIFASMTLCVPCAWAQVSVLSSTAVPEISKLALVEVGPNYRVWASDPVKSPLSSVPSIGGITNRSDKGRRVVEIATGMNYWDGQQWLPGDPSFEVTDDAFVATRLQHKVRLEGNLNAMGAVSVITRDGITLHSTPVGIGLYDAASGKSTIIAAITNCTGVLVSSNQVAYENAFAGVCAGIIYTIEVGSFEQDVIITGRLNPADYGFPTDTTQIQILTEFYQPPEPERLRHPIYVEEDQAVRNRMVSPDLVDEVLGFGEFVLATGRASTLSQIASDPDALAAPVAKQFATVAERKFLIESVQYSAIQEDLLKLPECVTKRASIKKTDAVKTGKADYTAIPSPPSERNSLSRTAAHRTVKSATRSAMVAFSRQTGVSIDYKATIGGTLNNPVPPFQGDTTYLVTGAVVCNGPVTIEGGAVFKFKYLSPTTGGSIKLLNTLTCKTSNYRAAIFTAVDDESVGESMNGYPNSGFTGNINNNKYANPALWVYYLSSQTLSNIRFSYCQEALRIEGGGNGNALWHAQLVKCIRGIVITGCGAGCGVRVNVNNCLFANVQYPLTDNWPSTTANLVHCTIDAGASSRLVTSSSTTCSANFTNSVFANVSALYSGTVALSGNYNGFDYVTPLFGNAVNRWQSASPFQSQVAGNYYLATGSPFINKGNTSGVDSSLLNDLKTKSTYPPTVLVAGATVPATMSPRVQRDTDTLGYHYDALDYVLNNVTLSATLTLTNGVALGLQNTYGLDLQPGARVSSEGAPLKMNRVSSLANVQEQPIATGGSTFMKLNASSGASDLDFRFTDVSVGQGMLGTPLDTGGATSYPFDRLSFRDCWLHGAALTLYPATASTVMATFTNNIIDRCKLAIGHASTSLNTAFSVYFYNNLFLGDPNSATPGTPPALSLSYDSGSSNPGWEVHDNLFDKATQSLSGNGTASVLRSNNGFTSGTTYGIVGTSDQTAVTLAYQTGVLGKYYLPNTATQLIDHGSRTADVAGLYHYTTLVGTSKEQNLVDIGFHYVAVDGSGRLFDWDGDGFADYLEDADGDGVADFGESNWQSSINLLTAVSPLDVFTPLKN